MFINCLIKLCVLLIFSTVYRLVSPAYSEEHDFFDIVKKIPFHRSQTNIKPGKTNSNNSADSNFIRSSGPVADPLSFRSSLLPTSNTLKKGQIVYENYYVSVNNFWFGVYDRLSINLGFYFPPFFGGFPLLGVKCKIIELGHFSASSGLLYVPLILDADYKNMFLYRYGVIGAGKADHYQLNLSYGHLISNCSDNHETNTFIAANALLRISDGIKLHGDVAFPLDAEKDNSFGFGARFFRKKWTFDMGFVRFIDEGSFPLLSIGYVLR